jgi:hypothetical protein
MSIFSCGACPQMRVRVSMLTPAEMQDTIEETVYEFQVWSVLNSWEAMDVPGRFEATVFLRMFHV